MQNPEPISERHSRLGLKDSWRILQIKQNRQNALGLRLDGIGTLKMWLFGWCTGLSIAEMAFSKRLAPWPNALSSLCLSPDRIDSHIVHFKAAGSSEHSNLKNRLASPTRHTHDAINSLPGKCASPRAHVSLR